MSIICPKCGYNNTWDVQECEECGHNFNKTINQADEVDNDTYEATASSATYPEIEYQQPKQEIETFSNTGNLQEEPDEAVTSEPEETLIQVFFPPVSVTRLEIDDLEPEIPPTSPVTTVELTQAVLVKADTGEKFNLPSKEKLIYIGRVNEEFPVQIDLSRLPDNDIISRVHAAIHVDGDNYYLEDAGSSNGTWLNDEKISPGARFRKQLKSGDTIAFGKNKSIKLIFEIDE